MKRMSKLFTNSEFAMSQFKIGNPHFIRNKIGN